MNEGSGEGQETEFSVLIVNFNGGPLLRAAVESALAQKDVTAEVIVIDNASTDGSLVDVAAMEDRRVRILAMAGNLGFAEANNRGAEAARGRWLALLNPDAVADENWLRVQRAFLLGAEDDPLLASTQLAMDDGGRLDGLGDAYLGVGVPWRGGHGLGAHLVPERPHEVFGPCGAGFVIARALFMDLGGFPTHFFCYCEDVDLAFRARLRGHRTVFLPEAVIHHEGSAITGKASAFALFHGTRNRMWVFVRNMPGWSFWLLFPLHLLATLAICLYGLKSGRFRPSMKGFLAGLAGLPRALRERRTIQRARVAPPRAVLRAMSWNPARLLSRRPDLRPLYPARAGEPEGAGRGAALR